MAIIPEFPVVALAIYLASFFLPADVTQFQSNIEGHEVTWTRNEKGYWTPGVPNPLGPTAYQVDGQKVIAAPLQSTSSSYKMSEFIKLPEKPDWSALKTIELTDSSYGSAIQIRRLDVLVTFSQANGPLSENPIIFSWGDPETR